MDYKLKLKWITALEGGEYQQGIGSLYNRAKNEHCCLGVLVNCMGYQNEAIHSGTLRTFFGHKEIDIPLSYDMESKLIKLNDTEKRNFKEIAQYIKEHIPVEETCQNNQQ